MSGNKITVSNFGSPYNILRPCNLNNLIDWVMAESKSLKVEHHAEVVSFVSSNIDSFVEWPKRAELLWKGCFRGDSRSKHTFPEMIKAEAKEHKIAIDGRSNGPAIMAFHFAGGQRPSRYGSKYEWSIHHLYSHKFPYLNRIDSLWAVKDGNHFTQSAGLVAIHPISDALCDEFPFFAWFLRATSYLKYGYDPDNAFSESEHDEYGFANGYGTVIRYKE